MKVDDENRGDDEAGELPFSHETLVLFQRLQRTTAKEERIQLTLELASRFAAEYDPSDSTATDDVHGYFDELAKTKLAYEQSAMRVGRLAADCIGQFLAASNVTIEEVTDVAVKSLN